MPVNMTIWEWCKPSFQTWDVLYNDITKKKKYITQPIRFQSRKDPIYPIAISNDPFKWPGLVLYLDQFSVHRVGENWTLKLNTWN